MLKALALTFLLIGCVSQPRDLLEDCVARQVELYGDICAESSTGYESMNGREAHFEGVKCATDAVLWCIDAN